MRKTFNSSAPWLPWLIPSAIGVLDAANVISKVATPLYVALFIAAATVTTLTQGPRAVCRTMGQRWEQAAQQAQIARAVEYAYQMHVEHCETHREAVAGELRQAVGGETTAPLPSLHIVRTPADADSGHDAAFRRAANIGRAAVPQQAGRPAQMAASRRLRPDA